MVVEAQIRTPKRVTGGSFLVEDLTPEDIFTVEDLSPEQRQIADVAAKFAEEKISPQVHEIEAKNWDVSRKLMRDLGALGLLGIDVPEQYGGLDMDKITSTLVAQNLSASGSFSVTYSAHVTIGTLPLVWYGTPEQKEKYLPRLASGEWIAAYALSESSAGSDAMNIRTRATLTPDGKHYVLNGEKMWISNAGIAGLFTIFAKIDGEKFSAFLVEAGTPGLTVGAEEHKLGIRGSSTCALVLADCQVPVENLLGQGGKGHHIAFNILNVGRYKLASSAVGGGEGFATRRYPLCPGAGCFWQADYLLRLGAGEDRPRCGRYLRNRGGPVSGGRRHRYGFGRTRQGLAYIFGRGAEADRRVCGRMLYPQVLRIGDGGTSG